MYSFEYDPLDRLADSRHYLNASPSNSFEEKNISYDLNGNILTMTRVGESGDENEVTYSYSGNQLTSSIYDLNGNITYDVTSGLTMEWNHLDLIKKVSNNSGVLINYTYLSDGTKVRSVDASGEGLEYRGSLTFRRSSDGTLTPEGIAFPGGRFVAMQGADGSIQMVPNYHIADHLGSVRTIVNGSTGQVVETNDYYAFGGRWDRSGSLVDQSNRYRYNGKEEQATFGTPYSDYGARQYSSASGRWLAVDPLAEKYYSISPYAFCNNNPVNFVDHDGKAIDIIADVVSIGCGIYNLAQNIKAGNTKAAWGDVAGIGLDLACAVIPGVTINAGTAKALAKSSAEIVDEVVDAKGAWNLNPFDRGKSLEATLKGWGTNFPVIDMYDDATKTITSMKSLDLNAKSYKSGNAVYNRVKGYIDDLSNFKGRRYGERSVPENGIESRVLKLAIPEGATQSQQDQLKRLIDYAQQNNVQLNIVLAK